MEYDFVKKRWGIMFEDYDDFEQCFKEYAELPNFKANENIHEIIGYISEGAHFCMQMAAQYHLTEAFKAMKFDLDDDNIRENFKEENIGTPGRIAKIWCGADLKDYSELGSGRWAYPPRIARFKNTNKDHFVIQKTIELTSSCSHHFLPFSTMFNEKSYCVVRYIPNKHVIGISKLKRFINDFVAKRFYLQEDLTRKIGEHLKEITQSDDVMVKLYSLEHSSEKLRGAKDSEGGMTTEWKTGYFLNEQ